MVCMNQCASAALRHAKPSVQGSSGTRRERLSCSTNAETRHGCSSTRSARKQRLDFFIYFGCFGRSSLLHKQLNNVVLNYCPDKKVCIEMLSLHKLHRLHRPRHFGGTPVTTAGVVALVALAARGASTAGGHPAGGTPPRAAKAEQASPSSPASARAASR